jgi:hypothetical protein
LKNVRNAGPDNRRRTAGSGRTAMALDSIYGDRSTNVDSGALARG